MGIRKQAVVSDRYTSNYEAHPPFLAVDKATVAVRTSIIRGPIFNWWAHLFLLQDPIPVFRRFLALADFDLTRLFSPALECHAPRLDFALGVVPIHEGTGHPVLLPVDLHPVRP